MLRIAQWLLQIAATLFGVALVVFTLVRVVPGNPIAMMTPPGASAADVERLKALYGLDLSLFDQLVIWLRGLLQGDFGTSITLRQDVAKLMLDKLPATLELSFFAFILASLLGVGGALLATVADGGRLSRVLDRINGVILAVPDFLWALFGVLSIGVIWPLLPISGRIDPSLGFEFSSRFYLLESIFTLNFAATSMLLSHLILPALALALPLAAVIMRVLKNALSEVLVQEYITLARIRGLSPARVLLQEALRNAALPTLALAGAQFAFLIGGTVIVERIFAYPGIGNLAIDAVINRDLPLIQGVVLLFASLFIVVNLLTEVSHGLLDPRLR